MNYYVYMTINKLDNTKCYIGMSVKPISTGYKGSGKYINKALKLYGKNNFTRCDLGYFDNIDEAHYWEGFYIKTYKTEVKYGGYNLSPTGGLYINGCHSEESKRNIGIGGKGKHKITQEHQQKLTEGRIGRKNTKEQSERQSERQRGKLHHTEDSKKKLSKNSGSHRPEVRQHISEGLKRYYMMRKKNDHL